MKKVYYKNKEIIFDTNNLNHNSENVIFYNGNIMLLDINNISIKLEYVDNIIVVCDDIDSCFSSFVEQFVEINAAGGLVRNSNDDILMIYRNDKWDLPKGKLEPNENIENCAVREVEEECGVDDVYIESLRLKTEHIYTLASKWHLKTTWWYDMRSNYSGIFTPQIEEGISEVRWVAPQDVKQKMTNSYLTIIAVIEGK